MVVSADGRYRWIVELGPPPIDLKSFLPYYILIFGAVALVCWLLAVNIASPLRGLARTVDRFGAGDLAVRVDSARKDEIGDLSRAFDRMAERISTLLTAERRLLQDISHELRSPLARLSFAAELVRTAGDRDAAVERLKKEIERLADLVGELLQVTMAEGDPSSTGPERLRLDDLLMDVVGDCRLEADDRGCTIALRAETPLAVLGDREILRRAFENVVRNSIRYAPRESKVERGARSDERRGQHLGTRLRSRSAGRGADEDLPAVLPRGRFARQFDWRDGSWASHRHACGGVAPWPALGPERASGLAGLDQASTGNGYLRRNRRRVVRANLDFKTAAGAPLPPTWVHRTDTAIPRLRQTIGSACGS